MILFDIRYCYASAKLLVQTPIFAEHWKKRYHSNIIYHVRINITCQVGMFYKICGQPVVKTYNSYGDDEYFTGKIHDSKSEVFMLSGITTAL